MPYDVIPADAVIEKTAASLRAHGFTVEIVPDGQAAKRKVLALVPSGAEVMDMTSETLASINVAQAVADSGQFSSTRHQLKAMDRQTQGREMQRLGAAPAWVIGSVHAVTQDGSVLIASNTGSQLPAYAYGADHVVWVVGTQKIVRDIADGMRRLFEHSLPLESERARKAYGVPGSAVNKILIVTQEIKPNRVHIILVKEKLGF